VGDRSIGLAHLPEVATERNGRSRSSRGSRLLKHLALAVTDQERSRRFYETYFGFGASPSRRYPDGTLMLYDADGFSLALGATDEPIMLPRFLHFGVRLPDREAVLAFRERLAADGVPIVEEWDEPEYVSVKCRDPDGYVVEAAWEPS
jgi:catechol 2,3-dioxygenase-like lactoylglutathione lyase family enzyme